MGVAVVEGLQSVDPAGGPVLASVKHFVAEGGTAWGTTRSYDWIPGWWKSIDPQRWRIDQGDALIDEATLRTVHLPPYVAAIAAGARNIMVSYSSWNGLKLHAHRYLLTDVLKGELGFDGFLVSDWLAADQLDADFETGLVTAINAGLDMIMVPFRLAEFLAAVTRAVEGGRIPLSRIDDAVRRILRVKIEFGLFERPFGDESLLAAFGSDEHRQIAREAVRKSLVLLKNEGSALPLSRNSARLLIAGSGADNIGRQCGGWTIEWQGKEGDITPGTTLLRAVRKAVTATTGVLYDADGTFTDEVHAEIALIVLSEPPYAEGEGDRQDLAVPPEDVALVKRMRSKCDRLIVILYSGRPLLIDDIFDHCDALVAAWLPGTEADGITDVLFGDYAFQGKLPYAWPHAGSL
jgi:beta-glucosidase